MYQEYQSDIKLCKAIHYKHGKNYYHATRLLAPKARDAVHVLYAWVRMFDEAVDNPQDFSFGTDKIFELSKNWKQNYTQLPSPFYEICRAALAVFTQHGITSQEQQAFLKSMKKDLSAKTYQTYQDLEQYMYGSAAVVGVMFCKIVDAPTTVLEAARRNGDAMQLTNFIRDIGEDWHDRKRVYMPIEELDTFNIRPQEFNDPLLVSTAKWKKFTEWQIARSSKLYSQAWPAMQKIPSKRARLAAQSASLIYRDILRQIRNNNYDVFTKKAKVPFIKKLYFILLCLLYPPKKLTIL